MLPSISHARRLKWNNIKFDFRLTTTNGDVLGSKRGIRASTKLESKPSTKLGSKSGTKANTKLESKQSTRTSTRLRSRTSTKARIKFGSTAGTRLAIVTGHKPESIFLAGTRLAIATSHKPESIFLAPQLIDTVYQRVEERLISLCDTYTCLLQDYFGIVVPYACAHVPCAFLDVVSNFFPTLLCPFSQRIFVISLIVTVFFSGLNQLLMRCFLRHLFCLFWILFRLILCHYATNQGVVGNQNNINIKIDINQSIKININQNEIEIAI